jgi:hypothetical protein
MPSMLVTAASVDGVQGRRTWEDNGDRRLRDDDHDQDSEYR